MTNMADDAGPYRDLIDDLQNRGFVLLGDEVDPERFGNVLLLLRRDETRLRVVKDRSQWSVEIAAPGSEEWFSPAVWRALIHGALGSLDVLTPQQEIDFVRENLTSIEATSKEFSGRTLEGLRDWRAKRASARRGGPSQPIV
jgi:hypothetical protein